MDYYILDGKRAIPADYKTWSKWYEKSLKTRRVAKDAIGDAEVSTVFLSMDHQWDSGPPLLFETMVFGGPLDEEMDRCETWEQAEAMHKAMCERVRAANV